MKLYSLIIMDELEELTHDRTSGLKKGEVFSRTGWKADSNKTHEIQAILLHAKLAQRGRDIYLVLLLDFGTRLG